MDITQTLSNEIQSAITGNKLWNTYYPQWLYMWRSYLGGLEYKDGQYLTRYQLETPQEYQARLRSTPLDNHCQSVISVYNSFLFREQPTRELGVLSDDIDVEDFMKDCDFEGRDLDSFMKEVATWASVFGHAWIMVAKPNINALTKADEIAVGVRPYVSLLTPLVVLDWNFTRDEAGRYELSYFRYVEDVNGDVRTVKEWTPDTVRTIVCNLENNSIDQDFTEPNGLGEIPAVICYNGRSTIRGIGVSDLGDIADIQRFIYNCQSEIEQAIRMDSHPSLVKTPETQAGAGAGSIITMPENIDPGLKPYLLEFGGASIDAVLKTMQDAVDSIDRIANTGGVRAKAVRLLSGVAMQTEFQLLNARLSEKADNIELAEEEIWSLYCDYQNLEWDGEITYPGSFGIHDTSDEINQLKTAADAKPTDPRTRAAIDMKILDWLDLTDDQIAALNDPTILNVEDGSDAPTLEQPITMGNTTPMMTANAIVSPPGTGPTMMGVPPPNFNLAACPIALQDNAINVANHLDTIAKHGLGPADPTQPNPIFWIKKAELWNTTPGDAHGRLCMNCAHYFNTSQITECITKGPAYNLKASQLPLTPKWKDMEEHPVAYCNLYDITCSPTRTCDQQEPGGPMDDIKCAALGISPLQSNE